MIYNKPTLLISEKQVRENIFMMAAKASKFSVAFRPHFKTHQSREIADIFREAGVNQITVSSLGMAEYFAACGWVDILVAFPANKLEIETINKLASRVSLGLLFTSIEDVAYWEENLQQKINGWIKVDTGYHRCGIKYFEEAEIIALARSLEASEFISFKGLLTHAGHTYLARGEKEILEIHNESCERLMSLKEAFQTTGVDPVPLLSMGDTPACTAAKDFRGIDEIRPGNFVFYDCIQAIINPEVSGKIACTLACPVVQIKPDEKELIVYGGGVHFSKDFFDYHGKRIHGFVAEVVDGRFFARPEWGYLASVSQEHGIVQLSEEFPGSFETGDNILIIPAHSCMAAEMFREYLTLDGRAISRYQK